MVRVATVVGVLVLALVATPVRAEKGNAVEKMASDAAAAYRAGEYQRAATLLERAYKLQPLSALLYNLAKAYDKLGEEDKAAELYGRYAAADDADPRLRTKAEARVAALRPEKEREHAHASEPSPRSTVEAPLPAPRPQPEAKPPAVAQTPPPPVDPTVERRHELERGRARDRNVTLAVGAVGVAALATAVGLSVNVLGLQSRFQASGDETVKRDLRSQGQTQALAADLLYVSGAVCVGVAGYFLYRVLRPLPKTVALAPWAAPAGGGVVAQGRF
jgi:tetratricopeptide (TPR) repeat protein